MAINGNAVIIHIRRQQGIGTCDIEAVYNATVIIGYGIDKFRLTEQTVIGQWRLAIPMPVFQSCPERVQSTVIVSRINIPKLSRSSNILLYLSSKPSISKIFFNSFIVLIALSCCLVYLRLLSDSREA